VADDGANTLSRHYSYDPDGNPATTGSRATTNLLFAGGHQLNNMYHYGAPYYDPVTATWAQQDPINQITSLTQANHYAYVGGNPIDNTDPTGLCLVDIACDAQKKALRNLKTAASRTVSQTAGCVGAARAVAPLAAFYGPYGEAALVGGACVAGAAGLSEGITKAAGNR
jgi:RHS repeat-associated protein